MDTHGITRSLPVAERVQISLVPSLKGLANGGLT